MFGVLIGLDPDVWHLDGRMNGALIPYFGYRLWTSLVHYIPVDESFGCVCGCVIVVADDNTAFITLPECGVGRKPDNEA